MRRFLIFTLIMLPTMLQAQIGRRFPSERKVITDPRTGVELVFLTSKSGTGDSKIYQTHNQWTADGKWVVFRSDRVPGEAMAVNEETGDIVQVTEGGFSGMLCVARKSMNLYHMRTLKDKDDKRKGMQVVEVNLERLFADSEAGKLKNKKLPMNASAEPFLQICAARVIWLSTAARILSISVLIRSMHGKCLSQNP